VNRRRALSQLSLCLGGQIPDGADWQAIVSLANEQLITPDLHLRLAKAPGLSERIPNEVRMFLADVDRRNRARNDSLSRTLQDALSALNAAGIVPVLLKGCALWGGAGGGRAGPARNRILCDLDLLVRPNELQHAVDALAAREFAILEDHRSRTFHRVVEVGRTIDAGTIDLHQSTPGPHGILAIDDLLAYCSAVEIGGGRAMLPSPEFQVFTAVLHDQLLDGHFWRGGFHFRHLLDIAELTRREQEMDWQKLIALCPSHLTRSAMKTQLLMAREVAGASVPDWIVDGFWTRLHCLRHRMFFMWPAMSTVFRTMGLNERVWREFAS
jgi:hypothetical protein